MKPIEQRLETIERLLREVLKEKKNSDTWVKASTVKEVTGWGHEKLRWARDNKFVKMKKEDGFWYSLESIPEVFKKKTA